MWRWVGDILSRELLGQELRMNKQSAFRIALGVISGTLWLASLTILFFAFGCASATKIKQEIGADLAQIIQTQDCPTICFALKAYMRTRLGMEVPE